MEEMVGAQRTAHGGWFQSIPPGQRGEHPSGLGLAADREREQEALETRRQHARRRRSGAVLEAHQHQHFDADRAAIELEGFVATAVEEEVGLDEVSPLGGMSGSEVFRPAFIQDDERRNPERKRKEEDFSGPPAAPPSSRSIRQTCEGLAPAHEKIRGQGGDDEQRWREEAFALHDERVVGQDVHDDRSEHEQAEVPRARHRHQQSADDLEHLHESHITGRPESGREVGGRTALRQRWHRRELQQDDQSRGDEQKAEQCAGDGGEMFHERISKLRRQRRKLIRGDAPALVEAHPLVRFAVRDGPVPHARQVPGASVAEVVEGGHDGQYGFPEGPQSPAYASVKTSRRPGITSRYTPRCSIFTPSGQRMTTKSVPPGRTSSSARTVT